MLHEWQKCTWKESLNDTKQYVLHHALVSLLRHFLPAETKCMAHISFSISPCGACFPFWHLVLSFTPLQLWAEETTRRGNCHKKKTPRYQSIKTNSSWFHLKQMYSYMEMAAVINWSKSRQLPFSPEGLWRLNSFEEMGRYSSSINIRLFKEKRERKSWFNQLSQTPLVSIFFFWLHLCLWRYNQVANNIKSRLFFPLFLLSISLRRPRLVILI